MNYATLANWQMARRLDGEMTWYLIPVVVVFGSNESDEREWQQYDFQSELTFYKARCQSVKQGI